MCFVYVYIFLTSWNPGSEMWVSHTLITGTRGLNLEDNCVSTSPSSCWCFRTFLIFMILTIAACTVKLGRSSCLGAKYLALCVKSLKCPTSCLPNAEAPPQPTWASDGEKLAHETSSLHSTQSLKVVLRHEFLELCLQSVSHNSNSTNW